MKRAIDCLLSATALLILSPVMLVVSVAVRLTSPGPALYWSERIGRNGASFQMPKFRTMVVGTPPVATALLTDPGSRLTPIGSFLRRTSLDELPQLWSIFTGHMSIVGPRPALFNQEDLIALRREQGVDRLRPGLTGWAQINGRDELSVRDKVRFDSEYAARATLAFDFKIVILTCSRVLGQDSISH